MTISTTDLRNDIDDFETAAELIQALFADIDTARDTLVNQLHSTGVKAYYGPAFDIFERQKACLESGQADLVALFRRRILDRTETQLEMPELYNGTIEEFLMALWEHYIATAATETANTVSVSAITKDHSGTNTGNLHYTKKLPGNVSPGEGLLNYSGWQGVDSQMSETDSIACITRDAATCFISGLPGQNVPYGQFGTFGNKGYGQVPCDGGANLITNFFEDITSNVPDGWSLDTGTAGSTCVEETTEVMRGSKAIELNGANTLSYPIADLVEPGQNLLLSIWGKRDAATAAGTVTIRMVGTGMTTQTSTFNATSLSTSGWTENTLHLQVPLDIPDDLSIEIVTASVSASGVWLDGGNLQPYTYWAGLGWAITQGPDDYVSGDKWTGTITNTYAGGRNTWMFRTCGFQLPS